MRMFRPAVVIVLAALLLGCGGDPEPEPVHPGVFVIGFDGMDPGLVEQLMAAGRMPAFKKFADAGGYSRFGTSLPPESPVAWSNFITGTDPGGHGIFDFIHREVSRHGISLYLATAKTTSPSDFFSIPFTGYHIPRDAGETTLLVKGKYFWEYLVERGIPASVMRVPSNYPPKEVGARTFSGMGTPDVLGSYGTFSYFVEDPPANAEEMSGTAHVIPIEVHDGRVRTELRGPRNAFKKTKSPRIPPPYATVPMNIWIDADRKVARFDVGDETRILSEGDWSDWIPVNFPMIPVMASASGIVRLYVKELSPSVKIYASPVNVDPRSPDLAISTPPEASEELAAAIGLYYTQGMAEDTQACRYEVLDTEEYLEQAMLVYEERKRMLDHEVDRFARLGGLSFFYVSTTDLCAHMLWQYMDPTHPLYDAVEAEKYKGKLAEIYEEMDRLIADVEKRLPEGTRILILSDHGFESYRRQLNLNTWLFENGYLKLKYPDLQGQQSNYRNVDWLDTRAYAVGFSGIYLNLVGREDLAIVEPGEEAEKIKADIIRGLEALVDPVTGEKVVTKVHRREDVYHGPEVRDAPDLVVGFNAGFGCSDDSVKGTVSRALMKDTDDAWSGSHLMDPVHVPGILLANTPITLEDPRIYDLPVSILGFFGIEPTGMQGREIWKTKRPDGEKR